MRSVRSTTGTWTAPRPSSTHDAAERADPKIINASHRQRIAKGSGWTVSGQCAGRPVLRGAQDDVRRWPAASGSRGRSATNRRRPSGRKGKKGNNRAGSDPKVRAARGGCCPAWAAACPDRPGSRGNRDCRSGLDQLPAGFDLSRSSCPRGAEPGGPGTRAVNVPPIRPGTAGLRTTVDLWIANGGVRGTGRRRVEIYWFVLPGLVDAHCHVGYSHGRCGDADEAATGPDRSGRRRLADPRLRLARWTPAAGRPDRPARDDPGRSAHRQAKALHPEIGVDPTNPRWCPSWWPSRPGTGTGGSSWSATGSTAASATWPRSGRTSAGRGHRGRPRGGPGSPPTCSPRTPFPG